VSMNDQRVALPKLYGGPAYARPPAPVAAAPRPFDLDELPLQVFQTDDEIGLSNAMPARDYSSPVGIGGDPRRKVDGGSAEAMRPRMFRIREIAGRLLGGP
jgi:hypothetical protein